MNSVIVKKSYFFCQKIKISKNNVAEYLLWLEKAGMIGQLRDDTGGMRGLGKAKDKSRKQKTDL